MLREDAFTPRNGDAEMNVTVLEDQIKHYYGSASATVPANAPACTTIECKSGTRAPIASEGYTIMADSAHQQVQDLEDRSP
jgi:hypothetical protein